MLKLFLFILIFTTGTLSLAGASISDDLQVFKVEDVNVRKLFMRGCENTINRAISNGWVSVGGINLTFLLQLTSAQPPKGVKRINVAPFQGTRLTWSNPMGEAASCVAYSNGDENPWIFLNRPIEKYSEDDLERLCVHELVCSAGFDDSTYGPSTQIRWMSKSKSSSIPDVQLKKISPAESKQWACKDVTCRGGSKIGGAGDIRSMQLKEMLVQLILSRSAGSEMALAPSELNWLLKVLNCPVDVIDSISDYANILVSLGGEFEGQISAETQIVQYYDHTTNRPGLLIEGPYWEKLKNDPASLPIIAQMIDVLPVKEIRRCQM